MSAQPVVAPGTYALRIRDAADALGISENSLRSLIRAGRIGYVRLNGGSMRVVASEIERFIRDNMVRA